MSEILGQQVVVENVGGAGGMTGSQARRRRRSPTATPIVLGTVGTHAQSQTLYKKPLYNAATDFTPVALLAEVPIVLIARKDLPANNLKEFVAYAKANQAKMQFGSAGAGSATHLGCVLLNYVDRQPTSRTCPIAAPARRCRICRAGRIDYLCEIVSHRQAADRRRHRQGARDHDQGALAGAAEPADRAPSRARRISRPIPGTRSSCRRARRPPIVKKLNDADGRRRCNTPAVQRAPRRLRRRRSCPTTAPRPNISASSSRSEIEKWAAPIKASGVSVD